MSSWLSAKDPQQKRELKGVYEAAKKDAQDRCQEREKLLLALAGGGEGAA